MFVVESNVLYENAQHFISSGGQSCTVCCPGLSCASRQESGSMKLS